MPARPQGVPVVHHEGVDPAAARLTRYTLLVGGVLALFLATFLVAGAFSVAVLDDPTPYLAGADVTGAAVGTGLLVADVVLPVPSSGVMLAHGALFGAGLGAALSLAGSLGATLAGYGIGRWAGPPLLRAACSDAERARADRLVGRWGVLAVAASRPVPLLAETVAVAAGASALGIGRTFVAGAVGAAPAAVLYAVAGAAGAGAPRGLLVFGAVLVLATALWLAGRWWGGAR